MLWQTILNRCAWIACAILVCCIVDFLYGHHIRLYLRPKRYAVWAGTELPPKTTWSLVWRSLKRAVMNRYREKEDLLDDIVTDALEETGTTIQQEPKFFFTIEPANIQAMLATQFKDYETGKMRRDWLGPVLGDSIFTSDGAFWEHSRALFRPQFSRDNINDLEATDTASQALIDACGFADTSGWTEEIELARLFFNFTLDTATEFLFGESIGSQATAVKKARKQPLTGDETLSTTEQFSKAMHIVNQNLRKRTSVGIWYWIFNGQEFQQATKSIKEWAEGFVQMALRSPSEATKVKGKKTNVLSALATECRDVDELRNQTLAILFAGRDTTASLLSWLFAELSLHPEVYQKLRKIVLDEFPSSGTITFAQLKSCRYMQHVINETLRLHPTVPVNQRIAAQNTTLPVGGGADRRAPIAIRKGSLIGFSVYIMHRRKDLWGENAREFIPERWEQRVAAWQYLPFSGGPRICLGQQFALTETSYVLVRMLQHFDRIEPVDLADMAELRKNLGLTMSVRNNVKVRLHKAEV